MPGLDGVDLYREVERRQPGAGQRMLFISGSNVVPDYEGFLLVARPAMLGKPFNVEELRQRVRQMLDGA
jgi:DNA-binding response OmpR family regulator